MPMSDLIIIAPRMTHRISGSERRSVPTGSAEEVAAFIGQAKEAGFDVVDARVFAGEEHIAGGFAVDPVPMELKPADPDIVLSNGRIVRHTRNPLGHQDAFMADGGTMSEAEWRESCALTVEASKAKRKELDRLQIEKNRQSFARKDFRILGQNPLA